MDLSFSPAIESFREEVRRFLREELPDDIRAKVAEERMDLSKEDQRRWHQILYRRGWAAPGWPKEHGG
jgi:alkylation response protein AidB-like acyl-CoA dehydrogenase